MFRDPESRTEVYGEPFQATFRLEILFVKYYYKVNVMLKWFNKFIIIGTIWAF